MVTDTHKEARQIRRMQRSSALHQGYLKRVNRFDETVAQRICIIYWLVQEGIANRKLESMQYLINDFGENKELPDFIHTSNTAFGEFVNESTDISAFRQYVTFIRHLDATGTSTLNSWTFVPLALKVLPQAT